MADPYAGEAPRVFSVSELVGGLRVLLEDRVGRVWVAGEISNLRRAASGHSYFSLCDERAQLRAVLFRGAARRLAFEPEDGLDVLAYGDLGVYEARGDLQLVVASLEPRGRGALQLAFEQLRARLEREGLFAEGRKRPLPLLPATLGVVTSPRGAALRDVLEVSGQRFPSVPILLAPTRVQGAGAEHEIAAALRALDARPEVEAILLVRGGGSLEDLQPFNTEAVARAIAACATPVVAGVGHEVDVTIACLAADRRAPTPSAAAALALPDRAAMAERLRRDDRRLVGGLRRQLERAAARLDRSAERLRAGSPGARVAAWRVRLPAAARALGLVLRARLASERGALAGAARDLHAFGRAPFRAERSALALGAARLASLPPAHLERARGRFGTAAARLDALSPLGVLGRGYAIARRTDGAIVRRADQVDEGDSLRVSVAEAEIETRVVAARARPPSR